MGAQNIIELGFNVEELTAEKKQVLDLFVDLFGTLQKYDGTKFNPLGSGGLTDLKKSLNDGAAAMDDFQKKATTYNQVVTDQFQKQQQNKKGVTELTLATNEYKKTLDDTAKTQAKTAAFGSEAAENLTIEKEKLRQLTAERSLLIRSLLTEVGSVGEAKAAVRELTAERDKQNANTAEGKKRIEEINAAIDKNNQFIKENSSTLEKQKINIGNYTSATVILKESLDNIGESLNRMAANGDTASDAYQKLILEQKLLQAQLDKQAGGFTSVNQELRATKQALDTLTVAGLDQSEAFHKLNIEYTTASQKVKELHNEQAILTSEEPAFTALTAAARGLGGAYAVSAGASALFAQGNEKVEKELNKLVAIMTVLQGLEEAVKAIKDRGAIATALQATATKLLIAAKEIEVKLFGSSETVIAGETTAKIVNTEATVANSTALEGNAASAVLNETAMEGVVIGTEAATGATIAFRTALITTGIGAIIIGIIYGITKLVGAIGDWIQADEKALETEKALAEASKELFNLNRQLNDVYETGARKRLDLLEKQDALIKASGQNQFTQLASERELAAQRAKIAEDELKRLGVNEAKLQELEDKKRTNTEALLDLQKEVVAATKTGDENAIEEAQKKYDANKAVFDLFESKYDTVISLQKDFNDNTAKLNENSIQQAKAAAELLAKISAEAAERRYNIARDANDRILNLETSPASSKLEAIKGNYAAEVALEKTKEEEIKRQLRAGIITQEEANSSIANLQTDLTIKYKKALDDRDKIRIEYNDRELQARNSVARSGNESDAAIQDAITKDVERALNERLEAQKQSIVDKAGIIADDYALQIRLAKEHGKTETEIAAITAEKDKQMVALTANSQKEIYDIIISYGDRRLKAIQDQNKAESTSVDVTNKANAEENALNNSFLKREVSLSRYLKNARTLERESRIEIDKANIADDEANLDRLEQYQLEEIASLRRAADAKLAFAKASGDADAISKAQSEADAITAIETKAAGERKAVATKLATDKQKLTKDEIQLNLEAAQLLSDKEKELAEASLNLAKTIGDSGYQNRINRIQETIDLQSEQSSNEIDAIRRSTLASRDQAAEIIILEAQQHAKETQLKNEQKQEKIKQAQFDQKLAAANVLWKTSEAEIAAIATYGGTPYGFAIAAIIAALGAVEVASIFATAIPAYAEGTENHPGGWALTGEAGTELVKPKGGNPFLVNEPTLLNLSAGSQVLPLSSSDITMELAGIGMMRGMAIVNSQKENNQTAWEIARWQASQMNRMLKKNNQKIQNIVNVHVDTGWNDYIQKKVIGKK